MAARIVLEADCGKEKIAASGLQAGLTLTNA